jgi:molybdopterin-containing oxidoreductase family molybdopterin binding subunit
MEIKEDVWIPTSCGMCYCQCGILAHRVNGVVVDIKGNPKAPAGQGRICSKAPASIQMLYDPYRVNFPLKRTNPQKGIGVDPKWKRISWDEALDTIIKKFREVKDPRGCYFQATTTQTSEIRFAVVAFMKAFGFPNYWVSGGGLHCGNGAHFMSGIMHAAWSVIPDFANCNYVLYFGVSKGHGAGHVAVQNAQQAADGRAKGIRAIVFDPFQSAQASKGYEWVPTKVGTDGALALGLINVLLNELSIYDAEYIKLKTNGPYLAEPGGHYVRDKETGKPLVWDAVENKAKTFDDPTIKDYALLGTYQVDGKKCIPGFQQFKDHVKKYTPEKVSEITTVPANTIRRIAKEFGENARIGSKIKIGNYELPYRPVAAIFFRGAQGHTNSGWTCISIDLLNQIVGCADTVGGCLGLGPPCCYGYPATGKPNTVMYPDKDGHMVVKGWVYDHKAYPLREPKPPTRLDLQDMYPTSVYNALTIMSPDNEKLWQKFKIPYRPEIMINFGSNSVMTMGNASAIVENFLKKFKFVFSFDIYLTEFTDAVADIVLPDACFLERYTPAVTFPSIFSHPTGLGDWGWQIRQPVVKPLHQRRDFPEVMLEIAKRLGIADKYYEAINNLIPIRYGGELQEEYKLKKGENYSWYEIMDRLLKDRFGSDKGLEYAKKDGVITWPKKIEEIYWKWFLPVRVPIYFEFFIDGGEKAKKVIGQFDPNYLGLDLSRFKPLADWYPCPSHANKDPQYDMFAFYWRAPMHCNSMTMQIPWLDEVSRYDPIVYAIQINTETAKKKGLKEGDLVWLENPEGHRCSGRVTLCEGIHPEHLAIAACAGHWTPYQPIARGKGVFINDIYEMDAPHTDPITLGQDICAIVKIYKAKPEEVGLIGSSIPVNVATGTTDK